MSFQPTDEQLAILDAFETEEDMVINAGAGSGKTTTLRLLGESTDRSGLYIAYNKAIQTDASKSFPENVQCRTAHSLAYGGIMRLPHGKRLMERLRGTRVTSRMAVSILGIPEGGFQISPEQVIPAWVISRCALEAVQRFCNSADDEITERNVAPVEGVEDHASLASYVAPYARKAWEDFNDPAGKLKFQHDHYLKIWALTKPRLRFEFILLDEAQDANPVIAKLVEDQIAQKVMVGDGCQAIYGWRGAIDAMSKFEAEHHLTLSQSFRFGPAVAEKANVCLTFLQAPLRIKGLESIASVVTPIANPNVILCRTNAGVIEHALEAQSSGRTVAIVGGTGEIERFAEGARELMQGGSSSHPDLVAFKSWGEVQGYSNENEGRDLKVMVTLIDNYGVQTVLQVCSASVDEATADLVCTTAHKAKGREWDRVRIANDFNAPEEGEEPSRPEMMLAYVALTRAKLELDHTGLSWIDELV